MVGTLRFAHPTSLEIRPLPCRQSQHKSALLSISAAPAVHLRFAAPGALTPDFCTNIVLPLAEPAHPFGRTGPRRKPSRAGFDGSAAARH
jgi:hypothetical protein